MKTKLKPLWVGSFVIGGLALAIAALLSVRSLHLFSKRVRFVAYFNEAVPGLDVGSPIKLRGVRVGRVATIRVHYDSISRQSQVAVVGELSKSVLSDPTGHLIKLGDPGTMHKLVEEGLRARIDLAGITGLQFIELDFFDPQLISAPPLEAKNAYPVVPTIRSGISELIANLSKIANNFNKVDFAGLSRDLQSLLATANHQVSAVDLKTLVLKVTSAAEAIEKLASSDSAQSSFVNLNQTATEVRGFVADLDAKIEPLHAELLDTLRSFQNAADSVNRLVGPQSGLSDETLRAVRQVADAAESLQRLTDFLEQNPSALISGKKRPEKSR